MEFFGHIACDLQGLSDRAALGNQAWDALTAGQVATLRKPLHMQVDQPFSHEGRAPIRERRQLSWQKGDQVGAVGEVAVVKEKARILLLGILIKMVNSRAFVREAGRRP